MTPTPGDLSALSDWLLDKAAREPSAAEQHMLREAAAALSALPAAGEPDGYTLYGQFRHSSDADDRWRAEARPVYFTPQPSAAEGDPCIECGAEHGQPCFDGCCCKSDAAVGAHGDGVRQVISAALYELSLVTEGREHDEAVEHIARRLAAHAAGKGVDGVSLADIHLAAQMLTWGRDEGLTDKQEAEVDAHAQKLFAALTRQPVAGDVCKHEWVSGDNKYVSNTLVCQRCYEIKPAATPTDGGEGES